MSDLPRVQGGHPGLRSPRVGRAVPDGIRRPRAGLLDSPVSGNDRKTHITLTLRILSIGRPTRHLRATALTASDLYLNVPICGATANTIRYNYCKLPDRWRFEPTDFIHYLPKRREGRISASATLQSSCRKLSVITIFLLVHVAVLHDWTASVRSVRMPRSTEP